MKMRVLSFTVFILFNYIAFAKSEMIKDKKVDLEYTVSIPAPHTHYFEVEIAINNFEKDYIDLRIPVWAPGSYLIREFPKNVDSFKATDGQGKNLIVNKINKNTWRIHKNKNSKVKATYRVYAFEKSVRTSFLDDEHGFISGSSVFMFIDEALDLPAKLRIIPYKEWTKISTPLKEIKGEKWCYEVPDFDVLADSPIEIGNQEVLEFTASGVPHQVVFYGEGNYDGDLLKKDLTELIEKATDVFGENPNDHYTFFVHNLDTRGGGLEHSNSTVLQVNRWDFKPEDKYRKFLSLAIHEYFHLWLVKRLRPSALSEYNYNEENYTQLLWVMEGFTSYYEAQLMLQSGFYNNETFMEELLKRVQTIGNTPGAEVQSVAMASFDAWIKFYRENENSINSQVSYYQKGMVLAAFMDLEIINSTNGEKCLDDLLKQLYQDFYKKDRKGITNNDVKAYVEKMTGKDFTDFFNDYIYGTKKLDIEKYLSYAGISLVKQSDSPPLSELGIKYQDIGGNIIIKNVIKGFPAYDGGINANDEIIAIDGYRVDPKTLDVLMAQKVIGQELKMLVSRGGKIREFCLELKDTTSQEYEESCEFNKNISKEQEKVREFWLNR